MEFVAVRTIDELGRIIVPSEARETQGWDRGTKLLFKCARLRFQLDRVFIGTISNV